MANKSPLAWRTIREHLFATMGDGINRRRTSRQPPRISTPILRLSRMTTRRLLLRRLATIKRAARYSQGRYEQDTHRIRHKRGGGRETIDGLRCRRAGTRDRRGGPLAPRNCQLTFLPPCKKTRSYVPAYVARARGDHARLDRVPGITSNTMRNGENETVP